MSSQGSGIPFEQMSRAQRAAVLEERQREIALLAAQEAELQRREEEEAERKRQEEEEARRREEETLGTRAQIPTGYIRVRWLGTFKMYSVCARWAYLGHITGYI